MEFLDRITQQPEIMGGKSCIRGMRVTVGLIVGQIAAGEVGDTADDLRAHHGVLVTIEPVCLRLTHCACAPQTEISPHVTSD